MTRKAVFICTFMVLVSLGTGLENGLARTPPMGWLHWERFRCIIDCENYPDECISEKLFRQMADSMVADGYLEAGYEYIIIDDCWLASERDSDGKLQADLGRFPNGIKALADYIHDKGLKFGIYEDYGTKTCEGYPGSIDHLETDAQTFAEWGVDYLKLDGCNADKNGMEQGYAEMGMYLNSTGRPIVFSCSFPAYKGLDANYTAAVEICNLWRNYDDIDDSWSSVQSIAKWFSKNQDFLIQYAGPGHWNDPDMLIIGNHGLSYEQSKAQMTIWTLLAAPLIMSVDLRTIGSEFKDILLNKEAIGINQDELGIQGRLYTTIDNIDVWIRPILPLAGAEYSYGLGFISNRVDEYPFRVEFTLEQFGLRNVDGYILTDVFEKSKPALVSSSESLEVRVKPSGAVLLHLTAVTPESEIISAINKLYKYIINIF